MLYDGDTTSYQLSSVAFEGNIIPHTWLKKLVMKDGKPDIVSCLILSEIIYWYRPIVLKNENGETILKKKYKADLLQKSYEDLSNSLGLTKRQCQDAMVRLEEKKVLKRVFRTIEINGLRLSNVLFIEVFVEEIKKLNFIERGRYPVKTGEGIPHEGGGIPLKRDTYTENTPEITKPIVPNSSSCSIKKEKKKQESQKIKFKENIYLTQEQYDSLLEKYGKEKLNWMLDFADLKISTNGYRHKSHYHLLLPSNWVHDEYLKKHLPTPSPTPSSTPGPLEEIFSENRAWFNIIYKKFYETLRDQQNILFLQDTKGTWFRNIKTEKETERYLLSDPKFRSLIKHELKKFNIEI